MLLLTVASLSDARAQRLVGDVPAVPIEEIGQATVAFANFASAPGLSAANLDVRPSDEPRFDLSRTSLGFQTDVTLPWITANAFVGGSFGASSIDQNFTSNNELGEVVRFDTEREILSGRVSGGLSWPITRNVRIRTYLSAILSNLESTIRITGQFDPDTLEPGLGLVLRDSELDLATGAITAQLLYDRWFGQRQLEIDGTYTTAYSNSFNESDDRLGTSGWSDTFVALVRFSGPTDWLMRERRWRWNVYAFHANFLDQPRRALGFKYYHEIGAGLDYEWNLKPLNVFGLRYVGLRAGVIVGNDVDGWNLGFTFR